MKKFIKYLRNKWHNDILYVINDLKNIVNDTEKTINFQNQEHLKSIEISQNKKDFRKRLYTPTLIQKIDNLYYIVDCWHHRIIYSDTVERPIVSWNILDENVGGPHSIVSNGNFLLTENTGYNSIKIFKCNMGGGYYFHKELYDVGNRPHKTEYCPQTKIFYVIGSGSADVYCFKEDNNDIKLHFRKQFDFIKDSYTRTIRIIDDKMFFLSGNNKIVVTTYKDNKFDNIAEYPIPTELASINDIYKYDDWFFITATPQKIVCVKDLNDLQSGKYIDIYEFYGFKGTPYYFSFFDGYTYLTEITEYSSIIRFKIIEGKFYNFERIHDFGKPTQESIDRKDAYKV